MLGLELFLDFAWALLTLALVYGKSTNNAVLQPSAPLSLVRDGMPEAPAQSPDFPVAPTTTCAGTVMQPPFQLVDSMSFREARRYARYLQIPQKVGGKDRSLQQLREAIKEQIEAKCMPRDLIAA
jgi:hypothetical protein